MIKVLHVSAAGERGGLEAVLLNILRCIDRTRFTPQVVLLEDGPFADEARETGTEVHVIQAGRVREIDKGWNAVRNLVNLIRSTRIQIVHSHNAKAHIYGGLAASITGVPSVMHLHGVPTPSISRDGLVNLVAVGIGAHRTIACSDYVAQTFRRAWHSKRELETVYNGTLQGSSSPTGTSLVRQQLGIHAAVPIVAMVTRLQRGKGVHVFLDAAERVVRTYSDTQFVIVGGALFGLEKDYLGQLQLQIQRLGLDQVVHLVGFQSDVFPFYFAADVVVQSSIVPEGFGMVLVEAMTCARPVVATEIGATQEIVDRDVSGLLVPPGDAPQLAHAIVALLSDPERRVQMGHAGAARVRERFSANRMAEQIQGIYEKTIQE